MSGWRAMGLLGALVCGPACTGSISDEASPGGAAGSDGSGADSGAAAGAQGGTAGTGSGAAAGQGGAGAESTSGPFVAHESVARRLSQAELNNTLEDLLGDDTAPATTFLPEDEYAPYDNDTTLQTASQTLIDSLEALAEDVAARLVADPDARARLVPCSPENDGDAACFRQVVDELLPRAFRRPVESAEAERYMVLLPFATEDVPGVDNDFYTAVGLLVRSILQDPEFLYRIEVGTETGTPGIFELDSFEIATRVSYLLWGSQPDALLRAEADAGSLRDGATRREQAERLLGDARAREQLHRFHSMWLGYRAIPHPPDLVRAFSDETNALIDRVVFDERRPFSELFTLGETYLDDALANHYGLPGPATSPGWVPYGESGRAGILSHGSVLAAFSKFTDTSPTQRGIFVRTRLMCQTIPRPPANVDVDQPPGDDDADCKYDRYEAHRSTESCANCHNQMDPIGFGLENFDIAGQFREHDDGKPECAIDGRGELPGYGEFSGPAELGERLVESGLLADCVVQQYLSFAIGHSVGAADSSAVAKHGDRFESNAEAFDELILGFVESDAFALRKEPAVP